MAYISKILLLFSFGVLIFNSCKNDDEQDPCVNDFNQEALFQNVADNIILPGYQDLKFKVDAFANQTQEFLTLTNENELSELRTRFVEAYVSWQEVAQFEFGPAEEIFLRSSVNNFPGNVSQIEFNIQNETNNFDQPDTYDQGFPALDYLLYGVAGTRDEMETVKIYLENIDRELYKNHLQALVNDLQSKVNQTVSKWENSYRNSFVTNTGTAAGTSLSQLINGWNQNYELIKRNKLGVPSGVLDLNFPLPDKVEAFYSGISVQLLTAGLKASEQLYLGTRADGSDGIGLDDFLQKINAEKADRTLDAVIKERFTNAINAVANLSDPLSESIENDEMPTVLAYNEVTKQVVTIKTDLPSVLCISITYVDNPSDSD